MANAAYLTDVEVSADGSTNWLPVGGANNCSQNLQAAMLEVTEYGDEAIKRIAGLFDVPCQVSGHRKYSDAGQALLVSTWLARGTVFFRRLHNGTNGFKVECRVNSFNEAGSNSETATFDCQLQSTGAPVAVP